VKRAAAPLAILIAGTLICLLLEYWPHVRNEYFVLTGARNETGGYYGLWSGFGGALPDVLIFSAMLGWYWHRTCHVSRCWRIGRHPAAGGALHLCAHHHPDLAGKTLTAEVIHRLHHEHLDRQAGTQ
jgi:hypothetical protein